ncbi:choice-of-anchor L domain-containing protein, partial [Flavobacterium sp.]|uniref:choice-of-anchor L domain-containing protein n=1 Tax=Flavobacterium sp. TaxID=239 RepID=UPI002608C058
MKKILLLFIFAFFNTAFAQLVVNNTTQTPAQLVQNVLLGGGITVSNITFNGTALNANTVRDQVGSFTGGNTTNIGINNGLILATGDAQIAVGPNDQSGATDATANPIQGDADLAILASANIRNKAVLEFDFVPVGQNLTFNFVFGSEEYLEFVNGGFNDVFGFFLSGPGITGTFTGGAANIALVPSTTIPISIDNVNDVLNPTYYVNNGAGVTPGINTTIQYDGFTTVIAATATVQCGQTYHIKLAIANVGDNSLDSAVFLQAQSFNTAQLNFPQDYLVANGFAPCPGTSTTLNSGLAATIPHTWTRDGNPIPGEIGPVISVNQPGVYCATAYPYGIGCPISDCVTVEYLPAMPIDEPIDLTICTGSTFNLSTNTPIILDGQSASDYEISYHNSLIDAQNIAFPITNLTAFPGVNGQEIWVAIQDLSSGSNCVEIKSFLLFVTNTTIAPVITCGVSTSNSVTFDWTALSGTIDYLASYQVNSNSPIPVGSIGNVTTYAVTGLSSGDNVNFTLTPVGVAGSCFVSSSLVCTAITTCPTITNPSANQALCLNGDPAVFSVNTTFTGTDAISYVYFNAQQTGDAMYAGGIPLGNSTPAAGSSSYDAPALGLAGSLPNTVGTYYVYAIANPIPTDTTCRPFQEIQVTVNAPVTAGTDGSINICGSSLTSINLFSLITGESSGGVWVRSTGSGGTFVAASGTFTPTAGTTSSTFTYTVTGAAPCGADSSVASVNITAQLDAGLDGSLTVCDSSGLVDLYSIITGEQLGGSWVRTSGSGGTFDAVNGTFTPAVGATLSTFTYTLAGVAPCISDSSVAT